MTDPSECAECPYCGAEYVAEQFFENLLSSTREIVYECEDCCEKFLIRRETTYSTEKLAADEKPVKYKCPGCGWVGPTADSLFAGPLSFTCPDCGYFAQLKRASRKAKANQKANRRP